MKKIVTILLSYLLIASGYTQTRNVLVGSNGVLVQPTNFWSANSSNAKTGLGLGTASTNPSSAFQPSSSILSNLSLGDGSGITNVTATFVGTNIAQSNVIGLTNALNSKMATNGSAAGLSNFPSSVLQSTSDITAFPATLLRTNGSAASLTNFPVIPVTSGGTGGTNDTAARANLNLANTSSVTFASATLNTLTINSGGSINLVGLITNASVFRTNIGLTWTGLTGIDATAIRSSLGLGTAATSAATQYQPSSTVLSNLANSNALSLTNIQSTNIVGMIPSSLLPSYSLTNFTGTVAIAQGGTGATNIANARQNLGSTAVGDALFVAATASNARTTLGSTVVGSSIFTLTDPSSIRFIRINADNTASALTDSDFRTAIGLGTAATNAATNFQASSPILSSLVAGTAIAISNGGTGGSTAGAAKTNLNLSINDNVQFNSLQTAVGNSGSLSVRFGSTNAGIYGASGPSTVGITIDQIDRLVVNGSAISVYSPISFGSNSAGTTRSNLGLGWSALTNSNSGVSLVSVDASGIVVSPTNWSGGIISPIIVQDMTTITTNTNTSASNGRFVRILSLASTVSGVTNTISLPTNSTQTGDEVTIYHLGTNTASVVTTIKQTNSTNNLTSINRAGESVTFVYRFGAWQSQYPDSPQYPIYFSGSNALSNAAATRTNFGLGGSNDVSFSTITANSNINVAGSLTVTNNISGSNASFFQVSITNQTNQAIRVGSTNYGINTNITIRSLATNSATNTVYTTNTLYFSNGILWQITTP